MAAVTIMMVTAGLIGDAPSLFAGEIGHFNPGVVNIRDYVIPEPGVYGAVYNYMYTTEQLNDRHGDEVKSVTLFANRRPGRPGLNVNIDVDVELYALAPTLMWVSNWKPLGARYAAYIVPTFANTSLGAALSTENGRGANPSTSSFGVGDMYVQPLWFDWSLEHFDFALGAGFYAPTGKYDVETVHIQPLPRRPGITTKVESTDNIGFGFWTEQTQVSGAWYPWAHKGTAVVLALTHEVNGGKEDFDLTPGQNVSLNWGVSQYLPLDAEKTLLLELGVAGYDTWQVSHDTGNDAAQPNVEDQVHAAGGQVGITYVPWGALANFHVFQEFAAENRFQGEVFGLNLAKKF